MLATMGRQNTTHMARVNRPKTIRRSIRRCASRRLCNTGTGTSVTGEGLADMVLATFSTETAAQITRSVLQQTSRRHVRHG
jgi:polyhydroxyalkanoate synthesis regulator protein